MSNDDAKAIYFISVASTLSGIHQQTIRTYEQKGLIKPFRTGGGTRRYSQEDIDKLIQIQNLSQRGINLDGIKIIYEMKDKIEELQNKLINFNICSHLFLKYLYFIKAIIASKPSTNLIFFPSL